MSKEERFNLLYQKILDKYNDIDNNRKTAKEDLKNNTDTFWITILFLSLLPIVWIAELFENTDVGTKIIMFLIIISIFFIDKKIIRHLFRKRVAAETYYKDYKEKVINEMIKSFNKNVQYHHYLGLDINDYREGDFEHFDRYHSEDLIIGIPENDSKIYIGEVNTYEKYYIDGKINYISLYNGIVAKTEIEKQINSKIYIREDSKNVKNLINIEQVELDSQEFENLFNVYSDNKIVTMQILTSDIMNMLIDFYREIPFEITIKNNNIYIRFFTGDENMFETPVLEKEALDRNTLYKYYSILDFTFELLNKLQETVNKAKI